ncbi:MAG: PSD1 and planctomycete cytochrome C domain-containing protein [Phycisphaerales bacterium]
MPNGGRRTIFLQPSAVVAAGAVALCSVRAASAAPPDFDREVRPILAAKCYSCHGPDAESRKAGLRLDTFEGATAALSDGGRAVAAGDAAASLLLARVAHADPDERMPPVGEPLSAQEIDTLRRWIESGAGYTEPWAFTRIAEAPAPAARDDAWCRSDIDRHVLATREAAGLGAPARDIDAQSLVRRLSFDLRGLPPDEADLREFAADPSDARYDALVDRYLADTAYGERWGRHWLDLARYAESLAHEFDYDIPYAWRYRDYVIDAFNSDLPPARFVAEQIMGDALPPRAALGLPNAAPIGTAWWFLGPATHAPVDPRQDEADRLALSIDVVGRSLFGLSIACARCHDHKFDPIPAKDYFALAGVARNTRRIEGFLDSDPRAADAARDMWSALADAARDANPAPRGIASGDFVVVDAARDGGADWTRSGHAFAPAGMHAALAADGSLRAAEAGTIDSARAGAALVGSSRSPAYTIAQRYLHVRVRGRDAWMRHIIDNYWLDDQNALLFEGMRRRLGGVDEAMAARDPREYEWRWETFDLSRFKGERAYVELIDDGGGWIEVDALVASDASAPPPPEQFDEDGPATLGAAADSVRAARAMSAYETLRSCAAPIRALLADEGGSFDEPVHVRGASRNYGEPAPRARLSILAPHDGASFEGSGRAQLVAALVDPAHPYLWRTTANRVWLKLFGRGIVETPDDFGQLGAAPWSPALLDHLAARLSRGESFKSLIRDIVRSRAYRAAPDAGEVPPTAWAPLPVRRLDAESIRDAMLVASGRIDRAMGGPGVPVHLTEHMQGRGRPGASGPVDGGGRRSVYIAVRRNFLDQFMQAFDQPAPSTTCGKRHTSNVPAQALALLNSELVHELAARWGDRVASEAQSDDARVTSMWYAAFARAPRAEESEGARAFLADERKTAEALGGDRTAAERAAFTALAHALFASKEFVFLR